MSATYERLDETLTRFIKAQKLFFVATAPLGADGHVNVSPKGYDSLVVLDDRTVAWVDLGGSGAETLAHLRENGRITLMFCALEGAANIVRLHGRGRAVAFGEPGFPELMAHFPDFARARAVVVVEVVRISDSCGWGVPIFEFKGEREQLKQWVDHRPFDEWAERRYEANARSIDGLPALVRPD
ncbi:MAG: pyridoxamine 5'-phosphate oxidase family protein [Alphaproteobacteria bacterium]|nr:pyridoxamine 5'-phosphate oxidase family protein [Alphaproteobacteria bacterium]